MPLGYQTGTGSRGAGAAGAGGSARRFVVHDLAVSEPIVDAAQRRGSPPVASPGKPHERGHKRGPDQRGVHQHREREADAEQLDEAHPTSRSDEHDGMSNAGRGDDAPGAIEPDRDRGRVVAGPVVLLLDAREQEDLVVHREAERDAEHQDRSWSVEHAGRRETEQPATGAPPGRPTPSRRRSR